MSPKTRLPNRLTIHPDYVWISETHSPERNLLWGVLERAIRDLCIRDNDNLAIVIEAIHWFKGTHAKRETFSYAFLIEELLIKRALQEHIKILLVAAEKYIVSSVEDRKAKGKRRIFVAKWSGTSLS